MPELNRKLLEMLRNSEGHLTAEEAFFLARNKKINVSLASVYRILNKLADENKIQRLYIPGHNDVFDKTIEKHGHFVCEKCGKVKDIYLKNLDKYLKQNISEEFKTFNLSVDYICKECR